MRLTKYKLGDLIKISTESNIELNYGIDNVRGISIKKEFINTKANMDNVSLKPYLLVKPNYFSYVPTTSRNGNKISIAYNNTNDTYIVSSSYIVFRIDKKDIILANYLFIYFNRLEFDRYSRFNSWGSAREIYSWEDLCNMEIELPPIDIQKKYVNIYRAMIENQKVYESGLEDLKLVCDSYIENLRKEISCDSIGKYIKECNEKNTGFSVKLSQGIDVNMQFIPAKREAINKEGTKIVRNNQFAFNKVVKSNGTKLPIALRKGEDCFISGSYQVFEVSDKNKLLPEYLMLWLSRSETQRFCGFNAWGSTRDVFGFDELCNIEIPIPDIGIQQYIVNIYNVYILRKEINEKLKIQLQNICPILIKGALQEDKIK